MDKTETFSTTMRLPVPLRKQMMSIAKTEKRSVSSLTIIMLEEGIANRKRRKATKNAKSTASILD